MPEKVLESLDAAIEGGGIDVLVEVVDNGTGRPLAHFSTTADADFIPTLPIKDVLALRELLHKTATAMALATPAIEKFMYDAIRLLIVTHYEGEPMIGKIEDQDGVFDCTDLFERGMLASHAIGDTGEYDTHLTLKGRIAIEQAFNRVQKAGH